jgi:hypothetical protein
VICMQHELTWLVFPCYVGQSVSQGGTRQGSRGGAQTRRQGSACGVGGGGQAQSGARQAQARRCYMAPTQSGIEGVSSSRCSADAHEHGMVQDYKTPSQVP